MLDCSPVKIRLGILAFIWLVFSALAFSARPIVSAFFYSLVACAGLVSIGYVLCRIETWNSISSNCPKISKLKLALYSVPIGIAIEAATVFGDPRVALLDFSQWRIDRVVVFTVIAFLLLSLTMLFSKNRDDEHASHGKHHCEFLRISSLRCSIPFMALLLLLCALAIAALVDGLSFILGASAGRMLLLAIFIALIAVSVFCYRKLRAIPFEICVLTIIVLLGSYISLVLPPLTGYSWDDQIHYDRALGASYLGGASFDEGQRILAAVPWAGTNMEPGSSNTKKAEDLVARGHGETSFDFSYRPGFVSPVSGESLANLAAIGYVPSAIGLWLARLLHLGQSMQFIFGKLFNLLFYGVVTAIAIKQIPIKKSLVAAIALIPTNIYLAASYSYDAVVTSFLILGVCLTVKYASRPAHALSLSGGAALLGIYCIGLAPKAIYYPLLLLFFFIPRDNFVNERTCKRLRVAAFIAIVVMVISFVLPLLFTQAGQTGDLRGGEGISAIGQIKFILLHPIEFLQILVRFCLQYVAPVTSDQYTVFFAYRGNLVQFLPFISVVPFLFVVLSAASDASEFAYCEINRKSALLFLIAVLITVGLVASALYVSFTPVAFETVNGCQPRYLLPLLLPAFLSIGLLVTPKRPNAVKDCIALPGVVSTSVMSLFGVLCIAFMCLY